MTMIRRPAVLAIVCVLAVTTVLLVNVAPASACSCASVDPVAAVAGADAVFTAFVADGPGDEMNPMWTFDVQGVIKGQVQREQPVRGEDWAGGCGTNFGRPNNPIVVFARVDGNALRAMSCMPRLTADAFAAQVEAASTPLSEGRPAAAMLGRRGLADFWLLDDRGRTVARTDLGIGDGIVSHCRGTNLVAAVTSSELSDVHLIDLETLSIVESRPINTDFVSVAGDRIACLDGGDQVVVVTGFGPNDGSITVATSSRDGERLRNRFEGQSRAVVHFDSTVILLPSTADKPLQTYTTSDLDTPATEPVWLPDGVASIDGDISPDGSRLAILATLNGTDARFDTGATHVVIVPLVDGFPVSDGTQTIALKTAGANVSDPLGAAQWLRWRDDSSWIIEHETESAKMIQIVDDAGGTVQALTRVNWGWGTAPVVDGVLRSQGGGIELVEIDGSVAAGDPPPTAEFSDRTASIASLVDAPTLDLQTVDDSSEITITPIDEVEQIQSGGDSVDDSAASPLVRWVVLAVPVLAGLFGAVLILRRVR